MQRPEEEKAILGGRDFCSAAALAGVTFVAIGEAVAQDSSPARSQAEASETRSHIVRESNPLNGDPTTAEILVDNSHPLGRLARLRHRW
jgi:hypothetical protein